MWNSQRGQSAVEFGASAIVLVLLLFGLVDLGRVFYFDVGLTGATREAARHASWFVPRRRAVHRRVRIRASMTPTAGRKIPALMNLAEIQPGTQTQIPGSSNPSTAISTNIT